MKYLVFVIVLILGAALWVRVAPSNPDRWHKELKTPIDQVLPGGVVRVLEGRSDQLSALRALMSETPRTKLLKETEAGYTFVTRSLLWGFPDYATVWTRGDDLVIYSRLRFGGGDMGVNAKRVDDWIAALPTP